MPEEFPDKKMTQREPYEVGDYRVKISIETARNEIATNFRDLTIESIEYLSEGLGSTAFLVNGDLIFRFAKNEKAARTVRREMGLLPTIRQDLDIAIPQFEYQGVQDNGLLIVGHKKIEGRGIEKEDLVSSDGSVKTHLIGKLADFFKQVHRIDVESTRQVGIRDEDLRAKYSELLQNVRTYVVPLVETNYPKEASGIIEYIERLFADYLGDEENFTYTPTFLHGDLEAEHIIFNPKKGDIAGIIDWGGAKISDPDHDLFRPYSHFGPKFMEEFLKHYPHPDKDHLVKKMDFFFRAQMLLRIFRSAFLKDEKMTHWHLERMRKQALGIGYWYDELEE